MGRAYSVDLPERVVAAVCKGDLSCHPAAAQFGVGISTAILWVQRFRKTGEGDDSFTLIWSRRNGD
jgi:putative transposase